ncbi:hypothetical protein [Rufibacter hautae]|uniref:STAS/SEC14 domain-containing protein n=1 Tax=Rufibacter hautae TaxID=2595005 RepID=A0A5B6TFB0_9BACT|nr:hypothetical protein [Rufibacter hautae]KAA3437955.1 hypothetical protein FOA19_11785 [Rufibacter hautae]
MKTKLPFQEIPPPTFDNDFVSIYLFGGHSLLVLEWKRQITLEERRVGFGQGLKITNQHQIRYWIIDDLQILIISPEEKNWVLTDWIAEASKSSILKLGVVCADYYPVLVANTEFTHQGKEQYETEGVIQHEVFTDYPSALSWLYPDGFK